MEQFNILPATPGQGLQQGSIACRVHVRWLGVRKTLSDDQVAEAARPFDAEAPMLGATKKILDTKDPRYRALAKVRGLVKDYWRRSTLPFTESGIRLLRKEDVTDFDRTLQGYRAELHIVAAALNEQYEAIRQSAREKLGRLYNEHDYPDSLAGSFDVTWDYPNIKPPEYLLAINPGLYQQEQRRVARQFEEAVAKAELAFAVELQKLTERLADRLQPGPDGRKKVFRDSCVENLRDFFQRFKKLQVRDEGDLVRLVEEAEKTLDTAGADELRAKGDLSEQVASGMAAVAESLGRLIEPQARRNITRPAQPAEAVA